MLAQQNYRPIKMLGKKLSGKKTYRETKYWAKKLLGEKIYRAKKILSKKKIGKIIGQKNNQAKKSSGDNYWVRAATFSCNDGTLWANFSAFLAKQNYWDEQQWLKKNAGPKKISAKQKGWVKRYQAKKLSGKKVLGKQIIG